MMESSSRDAADFETFWLRYLADHSDARTRAMHHIGISLALTAIAFGLIVGPLLPFLAAAPVFAYGLAWLSHAIYENNTPTAFGRPWWSLLASFRMYGLWLTGRLDAELARAGVGAVAKSAIRP
jgi:hypothetical protein